MKTFTEIGEIKSMKRKLLPTWEIFSYARELRSLDYKCDLYIMLAVKFRTEKKIYSGMR